jgi:hypothetical protein
MTLAEAFLDNSDIAHAALDAIVETLSARNLRLTCDTESLLWDELYYLAQITRIENA